MRIVPRVPEKTADVSRGDYTRRTFWVNTGLVAAFFVVAYLVLGWVAQALVILMPSKWEAKLDFGMGLYRASEPAPEQVRDLFLQLVDRADLPYEPKIHILDQDSVNAFALPGGHIILTTALLEVVETPQELAFVIGHELAHHKYRHLLKRLSRTLVFKLSIAFLVGGDTTLSGGFNKLNHLDFLSFSRSQEQACDAYALELVNGLFGQVGDTTSFFQRLDRADEPIALLSTHPLPENRIKALERLIDKRGYHR